MKNGRWQTDRNSKANSSRVVDRAFELAVCVVRFVDSVDSQRESRRVIVRQLVRAATSVGANVEEAQAAQSKPDFAHKMAIAHKEARETCYWLKLLRSADPQSDPKIAHLLDDADQVARILAAITRTTKRNLEEERNKAKASRSPHSSPLTHHS
ncbi:MAG: four helix bundle protein [Planctomycetota bacterium]